MLESNLTKKLLDITKFYTNLISFQKIYELKKREKTHVEMATCVDSVFETSLLTIKVSAFVHFN
jgi:hypothetical protein